MNAPPDFASQFVRLPPASVIEHQADQTFRIGLPAGSSSEPMIRVSGGSPASAAAASVGSGSLAVRSTGAIPDSSADFEDEVPSFGTLSVALASELGAG